MKKIFLCALLFTWLIAPAQTGMLAANKFLRVSFIDALSKDKDFLKITSLAFNLVQAVNDTKSVDLVKKYHKGNITATEKAKLLENLKFSDEAQLTAIYKSIFECRNHLLGKFPELQGKTQEQLVEIIAGASRNKFNNQTTNVADSKRAVGSCWQAWTAVVFICTIDYFNDPRGYDNCVSLAWDLYYMCLFNELAN